jgi:hypothetical protein
MQGLRTTCDGIVNGYIQNGCVCNVGEIFEAQPAPDGILPAIAGTVFAGTTAFSPSTCREAMVHGSRTSRRT